MPHALYRRNDLGDPSSVRISGKVRTVPPALTRDGERPLNGRRIEPPSRARRSRRGRGVTRRSERSRSEEHTSELRSLKRTSDDGFCLEKKKKITNDRLHIRSPTQ